MPCPTIDERSLLEIRVAGLPQRECDHVCSVEILLPSGGVEAGVAGGIADTQQHRLALAVAASRRAANFTKSGRTAAGQRLTPVVTSQLLSWRRSPVPP